MTNPAQILPPEQQPPVPGRADIGEALKWSWTTFTRHPWPMIVPGLLMMAATVVAAIVVLVGVFAMLGDAATTGGGIGDSGITDSDVSLNVGGLVVVIAGVLVGLFAILYLQGALTSGLLRLADGEAVTARSFLVPARTAAFIVTVVLVALIIGIGFVLLIIPGFIAMFALQYAPVFVLDQKMSPLQAISASVRLAFSKPGDSILVFLLHYLYGYIGGLVIIIGAIVTLPMGEAFLVHCYRALIGRPLARLP